MDIDIDALSEAELIPLNHKIVERLKRLRQMRTHEKMLDFQIGQPVWFESPAGDKVKGILTRYNQKTVTVVSEDGQRWNVSPGFLRSGENPQGEQKKRRKKGFAQLD